MDYIKCKISHNGNTYTLIHGFPGDTANGIILDDTNKLVARIGESCADTNEFTEWYLSLEDTVCEIFTLKKGNK